MLRGYQNIQEWSIDHSFSRRQEKAMAVIFELKNKNINLLNPTVVDVMEHAINDLTDLMVKKVIPMVVTIDTLNDTPLLDDITENVILFANLSPPYIDDYCYLSGLVGDILLELNITTVELDHKSKGKWFGIIPNNKYEYTVV
jgi:hypothetical protein